MKMRNCQTLTVNPFVSEAQRRACYAADDPAWDCGEWSAATKGRKLLKHKTKKVTANTRRQRRSSRPRSRHSPTRVDPTRTVTLRRQMVTELRKLFARLQLSVVDLVAKEDAFGLIEKGHLPTSNVFCPTGVGGGVDATCSPGGSRQLTEGPNFIPSGRAGGMFPGGIVKAKELLDKVPGGRWIREQTAAIGDRLTTRYGRKQAMAIVASGQAIGWGITAVGTVATGLPVYVPFSSVLGMLPGAALAEMYHQWSRPTRNVAIDSLAKRRSLALLLNYEQLTEQDIQRLGQDLVNELLQLGQVIPTMNVCWPTANVRWQFHPLPEKLRAFQEWLRSQIQTHILTPITERQLWQKYIQRGFEKGAGRAFDDTKRSEASRALGAEKLDYYKGTRDQFLKSSFGQPETAEKVQLLAARSYSDLEGVTDAMSAQMSRTLTDGLVEGKHPREIARDLASDVDGIGITRAETVAQTELIRAHAEGQLTALEGLGVEEVGVAVEWSTAGDEVVCPLCSEMEGVVLKLDEAHGMIPRHPRCRCSYIPANVGEDSMDQKDTKRNIDAAVKASLRREGAEDDEDAWGPAVEVSRSRPQSILNTRLGYAATQGYSWPSLDAFSSWLLNYSPEQQRDEHGRWTGDATSLEAYVADTYAKLYGPDPPKMKALERRALVKQHAADSEHLASLAKQPIRVVESQPTSIPFSPEKTGGIDSGQFHRQFSEAHARLDSQAGGHNFVSLVDLKKQFGDLSTEQFHSGLKQLQVQGKISLRAAEGRFGLTEEQLAAAVHDKSDSHNTVHLLYASVSK